MNGTIARNPCSAAPRPRTECRPWCIYADGHGEAFYRADQFCWSEDLSIDLTLNQPVNDSDVSPHPKWIPDHIEICAGQHADADEAVIMVRRESDTGPLIQWQFTLGEARQLVEAVQLLLGQIAEASSA